MPLPSVLAEAASAAGSRDGAATVEDALQEAAAASAEGGAGGENAEGRGGEKAGGEEEEEEAGKGLRMSEEELAKLKEEQEQRCRELAMNVNVFMPYEVHIRHVHTEVLGGVLDLFCSVVFCFVC